MLIRITVTTGTVAGVLGIPAGPRVARFIACGQTQFGPTDAPQVVRNLRDYLNRRVGARSGGARCTTPRRRSSLRRRRTGRAAGVRPERGQRDDRPGLVEDRRDVPRDRRSYYNAWTAAYTSASKTLTLVREAAPSTYTPVTAHCGVVAGRLPASTRRDHRVTVSSLPAVERRRDEPRIRRRRLRANVNWTTVPGKSHPAVGPGCIAAPGVNGAASALATHAAANRRTGVAHPRADRFQRHG